MHHRLSFFTFAASLCLAFVFSQNAFAEAPNLKPLTEVSAPKKIKIIPLTKPEKLKALRDFGMNKNPASFGKTQSSSVAEPGNQKFFGFNIAQSSYVNFKDNTAMLRQRSPGGGIVSTVEIVFSIPKNNAALISCSVSNADEYYLKSIAQPEIKVYPVNSKITYVTQPTAWDRNELIRLEAGKGSNLWLFHGCEMTPVKY